MTEEQFKNKLQQAEDELFNRDTYPDEFRGKRSQLTALGNNTAIFKKNLREGQHKGDVLNLVIEKMFDDRAGDIDKLLKK